MNEMTMNSSCMYDEVDGIRNLNRVEGFDPRKYMRLIQNEGQAAKYYLDVAYRKLWFRLRYPEGKIVKKILKLTEQVAIVEARVYLDRNDNEDNFISNALAQKYMTADGQFGNKFVELAETAAVGRALSDAGFGLQFADRERDMDPEVTEAPFDAQMLAGMGGAQPDEADAAREFQEATAGDGEALQEEPFPGQHGIEEYIPMPEEVGQAMGMANAMEQQGAALSAMGQMPQGTADASVQDSRAQQARCPVQPTQQAAPSMQERRSAQGMPPAMQNARAAAPTGRNPGSAGTGQTGQAAPGRAQKPAPGGAPSMPAGSTPAQRDGNTAAVNRNTAAGKTAAGKGSGQGADGIRKDMPVEQIYSLLDRDRAAAVVIPMGFNRGKTLGQLAVEKPANLQWYVDSYGGPDNLLRAAAKFLIDAALGQAG